MRAEERGAGIEVLRERLSSLSQAGLRISESLDVDEVLREAAESARALTKAACGGIVALNGPARPGNFVSYGLSAEEQQRFLDLPHGPDLWEYLSQVPRPLRVRSLAEHLSSLGHPRDRKLVVSFLGMPIRHQGEHVGNFYLADKEDGQQFTREDEDLLTLFSSHAGAVIANARKHRSEQRARADLEALIEVSPVAVVVLDAASGRVVSANRESRRIVGDLCRPGCTVQQLLEVLSVRRTNGRKIVPEELPVDRALRKATAIRAEEIVLKVPGGREIPVLVNATSGRSQQGEVESVVVTLQDMTPLKELDHFRAEFLDLVSHQLRAPLTSIKGCATNALGTSSILDPAETRQFFGIIDEQADRMRELISDLLDAARLETGTLSVTPESVDLAVLVDQARNLFRDEGGGNPVHINLPPDLPRVLADRQRVVQVLVNLFSNAARRSPESSAIRVTAAPNGVYLTVSVADEGRGIPAGRLPHLFREVAENGRRHRTREAGTGLDLAICKGLVEAHGGRIWAESEGAGLGARFLFTIPVVEEADSLVGKSPARGRRRRRRSGQQQPHVLVVDEDAQTLAYVGSVLQEAGYCPLVTGNPKEAPSLIEKHNPDLVLLDLELPQVDGIELMKELPAAADRPVIFLSAYGRDKAIARALDMGAADYLVKPFSPSELLARIRAALRKHANPGEPYRAGDLAIDYRERRVTLAGRPLTLTATEYDLLAVLSANGGRVMTYEQLLRRLWRSRKSGDVRLVRAFVKKLRHKLGDDARRPTYIFTKSRVGYSMPEPHDGEVPSPV